MHEILSAVVVVDLWEIFCGKISTSGLRNFLKKKQKQEPKIEASLVCWVS